MTRTANGMPGHPPARGLHRYLLECIKRDLADSLTITDMVQTENHATGVFEVAGRKFVLIIAPLDEPGEVVVLHRKGDK